MIIREFQILGLFKKNFTIEIDNNKLIIVADNGSGKTTILRLLYFFLTKQWSKIVEYDFNSIHAIINEKKYSFSKKDFLVSTAKKVNYKELAKSYNTYASFIKDELPKYDIKKLKTNSYLIDEIELKYDVPKSLIYSLLEFLNPKEFDANVFDWNINVIYLPTYRRIEKDYFSLYGDIDKRIVNSIKNLIPEIKSESVKYSDETKEDLNKIYSNVINSRNIERWIKSKSNNEKLEMIEFGMTDVNFRLKHFLNEDSSKKKIVNSLIELLNKYFGDSKQIFFNEQLIELEIVNVEINEVYNLESLSSGEKQLVSLFAHLFFETDDIFVIIDEPEISLSIAWQEMLLNDIMELSSGLFVATHSPFIIGDNLRKLTYGVNDFLRNE